jgi:D-aminoacyl-tRNA deacylase
MVYFVYCDETASSNIALALKGVLELGDADDFNGLKHFSKGDIHMIKVNDKLITAEFLNGVVDDTLIFLSRHSSSKGIAAFTVHALGNWSTDATLGGKGGELSVASPIKMLDMLSAVKRANTTNINVTYEATHHGPFLDHPSFFVELGGNEETIASKDYAMLIATAVADGLEKQAAYDKIALGLGGMHYSDKFTRLAIDGKYAFAHIMPKYQISHIEMIGQAFSRSDPKPELALIEWKSIKAVDRENILRELNSLGIDYAKV